MNKLIKTSLVIAVFVVCNSAFAGPPPPPAGPSCWPPPCAIPFDGGITILMAAGALYGGKKMYDITQKNPG